MHREKQNETEREIERERMRKQVETMQSHFDIENSRRNRKKIKEFRAAIE